MQTEIPLFKIEGDFKAAVENMRRKRKLASR